MEQLHFTSHILGKKAAQRLKNLQVIQTIRAEGSSICQKIFERWIKPGDAIEVTLDDRPVGIATYLNLDPVKWHNLDGNDARRGGFDNRFELAAALRRAGYRFKDLEKYFFWRCLFSWPENKEWIGQDNTL